MAQFNVVGVDDLERALLTLGTKVREGQDKALLAGGELLAEYFAGAIVEAVKPDQVRATGELAGSMRVTAPNDSKAYGRHVDVYPDGLRSDGKRNAEIGFYHEYGTESQRASHWMSNTVDDTKNEIVDAIAASILKTIDEALGG